MKKADDMTDEEFNLKMQNIEKKIKLYIIDLVNKTFPKEDHLPLIIYLLTGLISSYISVMIKNSNTSPENFESKTHNFILQIAKSMNDMIKHNYSKLYE